MTIPKRITSLLLAASLAASLSLPALASYALGDDLTKEETVLHEETTLATDVFWSTTYSDKRTENVVTYTPNDAVTPRVTWGGAMTDRSTLSATAAALEKQGFRAVAGINGDFFNTSNGLPVGIVIADGELLTSDGGYCGVGFRRDGTAVISKPGVTIRADLGHQADPSGTGQYEQVLRNIAAYNKARLEGGIYLYSYHFNESHTTGTTKAGVNVLLEIESGRMAIGETVSAKVLKVEEGTAMQIGPGQLALSVTADSNAYYTDALRTMLPGDTVTLSVAAADSAWEEVRYGLGALYRILENGVRVSGLPSGAAPRTAIGLRPDGTLVFYTIDGRRQGHSIGATMDQVAARLVELGCSDGVCLDGGGSTMLTASLPSSDHSALVNRPSDGSERAVTNHVFLVASGEPSGELDHLYLAPDHRYVLAGSRVNLTVNGVDTSYFPMRADYTLDTTAGTLEGDTLLTPLSGGEITVTASSRNTEGSTAIYSIARPDDIAIRNAAGTIPRSLTLSPGGTAQLTPSVSYLRSTLFADRTLFSWSLSGGIGTISEDGLFTAETPGKGEITLRYGDVSAVLPVTVSEIPLKTLEDFESETTALDGYPLTLIEGRRSTDGADVRFGFGAYRFDYDLESEGFDAVWNFTTPLTLPRPSYSGVNIWVKGDGSGNTLSFQLLADGEERSEPLCTLDFTDYRQFELPVSGAETYLTGLSVSGGGRGSIAIDQIVATYRHILDTAPPQIRASLSETGNILTVSISDEVDGLLPRAFVSASGSGVKSSSYNEKTGELSVALNLDPEEPHPALRVRISAQDASGNLASESVEIPATDTAYHFTDTAGNWAADYIERLYLSGVTTGYTDGTFRPGANISRAQFAVMLCRALGYDTARYDALELPFADLSEIPEYALPAIRTLYARGIVNGSADQSGAIRFNPSGSLTRAQAAAMIGRTLPKGYQVASLSFSDSANIPAYAAEHIAVMVKLGILSGYADGAFRPANAITRGQMAKILYNLL